MPFEIFRIRTQIGEHGGRINAGYSVPRRDRHTRRQRYEQLDDDLVYAGSDLDRSVVVPNQIRTVLETYRDTLPTDLFPGRTEVPKTLIFAKDDHHAEEIVMIAREVFARGNDFAKKITYAATEPEKILAQFRTEYLPRIAVTVDMIATGTDVKPIEALIFMRDVRSAIYCEQMRGRGVRSINPTDLARVTPDATAKDHFVLIDAVEVTESDKTIVQPLERKRTVSLDKLLENVASGASDEDTVSSLAHRLSALDRKLTPEDRQRVIDTTQGRSLGDLAGSLVDAIDYERIAMASDPGAEGQRLREEALRPFDRPTLRHLLSELKRASEIVIDMLTADWRAANPEVEDASCIIARISANQIKGRRRGSGDAIGAPVADSSLPRSWVWAALPQLGDFGRGKSKHRPRNDPALYGGPYPFVQTGMVSSSRGRITTYDQSYTDLGLAQSKLWPSGTICITIPANIAKSGILTFDACFPDSVVGLTSGEGIVPEYVEFVIRSVQAELERDARATAQKNINLETFASLPIPLPPTDEQEEIVRAFQEASAADDLLTDGGLAHDMVTLRQSILAAAFRGELVR